MKIKFYHYSFWNILIHIEKRKLFRKELNKYILDNNRLIIINPLNKNDEQDVLYKNTLQTWKRNYGDGLIVFKSRIKYITEYNYVIDIIDHFNKWYFDNLLKTKEKIMELNLKKFY